MHLLHNYRTCAQTERTHHTHKHCAQTERTRSESRNGHNTTVDMRECSNLPYECCYNRFLNYIAVLYVFKTQLAHTYTGTGNAQTERTWNKKQKRPQHNSDKMKYTDLSHVFCENKNSGWMTRQKRPQSNTYAHMRTVWRLVDSGKAK